MSDLISRQDAIDALERRKDKTAKGEIGSFYNTIIQHDIDVIVELPSAQPEVIRCKDCKHHYAKSLLCKVWSKYGTVATLDTDYCSYAERKERR